MAQPQSTPTLCACGCGNLVLARGRHYLPGHFLRMQDHDLLAALLWPKVDKNGPIPAGRPDLGPCWIFTGRISRDGYGIFDVHSIGVRAHMASYLISTGTLPDGLDLDHLCRVRKCVRPSHLEPVTRQINVLRGVSPVAQQVLVTHCPNGHPYDEQNTYMKHGHRGCRVCDAARAREKRRQARVLREQQRLIDPSVGGPSRWRADLTHCKRGHPFNEENTYYTAKGYRKCRACIREHQHTEAEREKRRARDARARAAIGQPCLEPWRRA
jgi:hypothetical protein